MKKQKQISAIEIQGLKNNSVMEIVSDTPIYMISV